MREVSSLLDDLSWKLGWDKKASVEVGATVNYWESID